MREPIRTVMDQAHRRAKQRGHLLAPFKRPTGGADQATSQCYRCKLNAQVWVGYDGFGTFDGRVFKGVCSYV